MDIDRTMLLLVMLVPLMGAFFLPLVKTEKFKNILAILLTGIPFIAIVKFIPIIFGGETLTFRLSSPLGDNWLYLDPLSLFSLLVLILLQIAFALYSRDSVKEKNSEYYFLLVFFAGCVNGLVLARNLLLFYFLWETASLILWYWSGYRISPHRNRCLVILTFGSLFMVLGFVSIAVECKSLDLSSIKEYVEGIGIKDITLLFILLGIIFRWVLFPFYGWFARWSGTLPHITGFIFINSGIYCFIRFFLFTLWPGEVWLTGISILAGITGMVTAFLCMIETDIRRFMAYAVINQTGFIFLGFCSGNYWGITGGFLYLLIYSLSMGGLFISGNILENRADSRNMGDMGGIMKDMPAVALSFLICSLSLVGFPPLGGFFAKYMVMTGAVSAGNGFLTAIFLLNSLISLFYFIKVFKFLLTDDGKKTAIKKDPKKIPYGMVPAMLLLTLLCLIFGFLIKYSSLFIFSMVKDISGTVAP